MTLTNIQHTATNCFSLAGNSAASAIRWTGHTIHSLGQSACDGVVFAAAKSADLAKTIISGASMYANMGWQVAKYIGARSWECAKIGGAYGAEKTAALGSAILTGAGAALNGLKCIAGKIGTTTMSAFAHLRAYSVAFSAAVGVKVSGALQGAGLLAGTYPVAAGAITLALGATAIYFASSLLNSSTETV